jgi:hypothetical protein
MGLLQAMIAAFAFYFLLHFYILPRLHRRLSQVGLTDAYGQIVRLLAAEVAHAASLIAGLSLAAIIGAILLIAQVSGHVSQAQLGTAYKFMLELRERVSAVSEWWGIGAILLLSLMLWLQLKSEAKRQFGVAADAAVKKLNADIEAGQLPPLPETDEMKAVGAAIEARRKMISDIVDRANAEHGDKSKADPKQNPELAKLLSETEVLSKYRFELDMRRRLDLGTHLSSDVPPGQSVLLSRQYLRVVNGTTRALSVLSLALLVPALVAIGVPPISEAALEASVSLHDLALKNSLAEAKASWEKGIGQSDQQHELDPQDQALIDQLSQRYAQLVSQQYGASVRVSSEAIRSFQQFAVRDKIVHDFASTHPALSSGAAQSTSGELAKQKALVDAMTTIQANNAPADGLAQGLREELTARAKTADPAAWQDFRAKAAMALKAVPPEPPRAEAIASRLFSEILNTAGRAAGVPGADNALHLLAENLLEPGELVERARELNALKRYRFLDEILAHGAVDMPPPALVPDKVPLYSEPAREQLRKAAAAFDDRLTSANRAWADHPPSLPTLAHGGQDLATAQTEIRALLGRSGARAASEGLSDTLATYSDYFPGSLGEETHTPRAGLMPAAVKAEEATASAMRTAFVRARSYGALRGFAKIGGVLIGLMPNDGKGLNITDLQWQDSANGVYLKLTQDDGKVLNFGPFRAELIRLALAYAADGRPVTVTMPLAQAGRKILMHPALLDSALGCEARQLDQFVDAFTGENVERAKATDRVDRHLNTYRFAWATQIKRLIGQNTFTRIPPDYLKQVTEQADLILKNADVQNDVEQVLRASAEWGDKSLSPVTVKPDYFDQGLVTIAGRCLTSSNNADAFRQCVAKAPLDQDYILSLKWAYSPPSLFSESGAREQTYSLTPDLEFLDLKRARRTTWPFSFIVQVTFETPGLFAGDPEKDFDEHPFEYPALKIWFDRKVTSGIAAIKEPGFDAPRVMTDMREFTVLQRLFRLAFGGKLGDQFPLEALIQLSTVQPHKATQTGCPIIYP